MMVLAICSFIVFPTVQNCLSSVLRGSNLSKLNQSTLHNEETIHARSVPPEVIYGDDTSFGDDPRFRISNYDEEFAVFVDPPNPENPQNRSESERHNDISTGSEVYHSEGNVIELNGTRIWNSLTHSIENDTIVHNIRISVIYPHSGGRKYHDLEAKYSFNATTDSLKVREVFPEETSTESSKATAALGKELHKDANDTQNVLNATIMEVSGPLLPTDSNLTSSVRDCLKTCYQLNVTTTDPSGSSGTSEKLEKSIMIGAPTLASLPHENYSLNPTTDASAFDFHTLFSAEFPQKTTEQPRTWNTTREENGPEQFLYHPSLKLLKGGEVAPKSSIILEDICLSKSCVLKAAEILKRMNMSVNPCDNFYEFSCGKYLENEVFNGREFRSVISEVTSDILKQMNSVLKAPISSRDEPHLILLKAFHAKCRTSTIEEWIRDSTKELGGWPRPHDPSWNFPYSAWQDVIFNWTYGMSLQHNLVMVNLTFFNRSHWVLNIDVPSIVTSALESNTTHYIEKVEQRFVQMGQALNIDNTAIKRAVDDAKFFMESAIKCANATVNNTVTGSYRLKELQKKFEHLDVLRNLPLLLSKAIKIDDEEMINVNNMLYLENINNLIRDSTTRSQTNFLVLYTLSTLYGLGDNAREDSYGKTCAKLAWNLFPGLMAKLYVSRFIDESTVTRLLDIKKKITDMHEKTFNETEWMDSRTKSSALNILKKLYFIVAGQSNEEDDLTSMDDLIKYQNSSFTHYIKTGIHSLRRHAFQYLHRKVYETFPGYVSHLPDAYEVNAFTHSPNIIILLPSLLHESVQNEEFPSYINFGFLGTVFGHEITHLIMKNLDLTNSTSFTDKELCLIDQFNSFEENCQGEPLSGVTTIRENIADLGGFREAYKTYVEYSHSVPKEKRLPGLSQFNDRQMYWLSAASYWCEVHSTKPSTVKKIREDSHAPNVQRINGQYSNIPEFAMDFNCPPDAPMNPKKRCTLW